MAPYEALFAFLVVMGIISIPLAAIITRSRSPIGQAIAERIRRRTEKKLGKAGRTSEAGAPGDGASREAPRGKDPYELIARQQESLHEMSNRLEFLERLLDREEQPHGRDESNDS